ncbi:MAG: glycosyltransferase [Gammaproteobacteria bacterium]|nr:glycosyltransferase [Gammaproteobacteria bacterium]
MNLPNMAVRQFRRLSVWFADRFKCSWRKCMDREDFTCLRTPEKLAGSGMDKYCDCKDSLKNYLSAEPDYQCFLARHSFLSCGERRNRQRRFKFQKYRPLVSILLPVYRVEIRYLQECLSSVEKQLYPRWELCVVEDGSGQAEIRKTLRDFAGRHPQKVKLILRDENKGIVFASQQALEMAAGEYVALLDHDDRLAPEALFEIVALLSRHPQADWVYSDNDQISESGERCCYHPKPDWSPELLLTYNYILHFSVLRRALVRKIGGFRKGFEGSQDHDLYLRMAEASNQILHVPRVLYSWRHSPASVSNNPGSKEYAYEAALRALNAALARRGEAGRAVHAPHSWFGSYYIERPVPETAVDILFLAPASPVQNRNERQALDLWKKQAGRASIGQCFSSRQGENAGQALARTLTQGESPFLLIVSEEIAALGDGVLNGLITALAPKGVAAAGPKIISANGKTDHCGLAFTRNGKALFPLRGWDADWAGHGAHGALPRNVSALSPVTALFDVQALRQVADAVVKYAEPAGMAASACFSLREKGFRITADGGLCVTLATAPLHLDGKNFIRFRRQYRKCLKEGDPYYWTLDKTNNINGIYRISAAWEP